MTRKSFDDLVQLMTTLRGPGGCPWDREQKLADLKPFIIEEAYEVVEAIDRQDPEALREEVGDLLLEAVFVAEIARAEGQFDVYDAVTAIHDKLVRRHPHVFSDVVANSSDAVLTNWEKMKSAERAEQNQSLLSGVPAALPALLKASRLTEKAARVGFDWENTDDVFRKLEEETGELQEAIASNDQGAITHELGDLLFTLANIARRLNVNAEEALQETNRRFTRRFQHIEQALRSLERSFDQMSLEELDLLWEQAKKQGL